MNLLGIWVNAAFDVWTSGARVCSGHSGGGADLAMGWVHLNGALRGRVVGKTVGGSGGRCSPMDFASLNEALRRPLGRG
jgi:hypothetical protein